MYTELDINSAFYFGATCGMVATIAIMFVCYVLMSQGEE